ncbi:MAG: hypothetical protein AAFR72_12035, partial [Pseudomonadota bacterium]
ENDRLTPPHPRSAPLCAPTPDLAGGLPLCDEDIRGQRLEFMANIATILGRSVNTLDHTL